MEKYTDALTKLPGRKALELTVEEIIKKEESVALALIDIDHFEELNNVYGSEHGDLVLQKLAAMFTENSPGQAYRVSGDEFAIVIPGATLEQGFLKMEALRAKVHDEQDFGITDNRMVTITIGVSQYPRDAKDFPTLNRAADAALMTAKEAGRNQIALPPSEEMVMKSCYYSPTSLRRLKVLAESQNKKESVLLREALDDLLKKHDKK